MALRWGLRICVAALIPVILYSLVAPPPASSLDWDPSTYFEIEYDVSFSDYEVDICEPFDLVVWGHAECIEMLPFGIDAARGVADFVGRHKETGSTEMLRAGYSASIGPDPEFPDWEGMEYTVDERVTLTFPAGSRYGDYEVIAQLVQAQVSHTLPEWQDVTLPESYHSVVVGEISCVPYTPLDTDFSADSGILGHPLQGIAAATAFQFADESSGGTGPYSYEWDFDNDGIVDSTEENPSWVYSDSDSYTVALEVTDSSSPPLNDTETKTDYITVCEALDTGFSADSGIAGHPLEGIAGATEFQFTDESSGGIRPYSYEWDFNNDGTIDSTLENPSYTYSDAGIYTVALTVTDGSSASEGATNVGYITVHAPVEADFYGGSGIPGHPLEGIAGRTEFQFIGESSGGTGPYGYEWDFDNDGIVDSTEENPSWTYYDANTFTVALTLSDILMGANCDTETKVDYTTVYEPLNAEFSADSGIAGHPREGIAGVTEFQFTDETIGGIPPYTEWSWYFGDGVGNSTAQNPSYVYPNAATYTVVLAVSDSMPENDNETKTDYVTICELGDANKDDIVNMADVTKVERIILALDPSTACADANQDGVINMADVTKIERIILGIDC